MVCELNWRGCYNKNLKGVICDEAFSHPAKFAYGLIVRIYAHLLEGGWLQEGDLVADPFAGVGIGGIVAAANGLRWIGIELEQKFIDLTVGFDCDGVVERHQGEVWIEPQPSGWFVRLRIKAQYWDASGESGFGGPRGNGWGIEQEAQAFADSIADSEEVQGYPLSILYWEPVEGHYTTKWVCDKPAKCGSCEPHDPHHITSSFELHKEQWEKMGKPYPIILQGDSRQFSSIIREAVDSVITSPPFQQSLTTRSDESTPAARGIKANGTRRAGSCTTGNYGISEGQIGAMKEGRLDEVVAVITSPPYSLSEIAKGDAKQASITDRKQRRAEGKWHGYGEGKGQLGGMPEGDHGGVVDSIITSPPYAESLQPETEEQTHKKQERIAKSKTIHDGRDLEQPSPGKAALGGGYGVSNGQLGAMREGDFEEVVNGVIASPPYPEVISTGERRDIQKAIEAEKRYLEAHPELKGKRPKLHLYGDSEGQIGHLREGEFEEVKAVITSPPYAKVMARNKPKHPNIREADGQMKKLRLGHIAYGESEDNLGNLPEGAHEAVVNGIVMSPPYEATASQYDAGWEARKARLERINYKYMKRFGPYSQGRCPFGYSQAEANIGNEQGDTYWAAVAQVYQECWKVLKLGGVMVVVVKDFVRDKKRVPLCAQTLELLEAIGFKALERIRAWLVSEAEQKSLMPDVVPDYRKAHKSFFRRLAERKGSPKINWEEVLIFQKPNDSPNHDSLVPQQKTRT